MFTLGNKLVMCTFCRGGVIADQWVTYNHRPLATPFVTCETKDRSTDRSQQECESDGGRDIGLGAVVVLGQLDSLDRERVEVEGVSRPRSKADDEVEPVFRAQLSKKRDWVLQRFRCLPLSVLLAVLVPDDNSLLPHKQVLQGLLSRGQDTLGNRVRGLIDCRHCHLAIKIG